MTAHYLFHMHKIVNIKWLRVLECFIVIALLVCISSVMTYPLLWHITSRMPGIGGDIPENSWTFWWFKYALVNLHQNPFITNFQFYPITINISDQISLFYNIVLLPASIFYGHIGSYNLRIFLSSILTGIGMYYFLFSL